VRESEARFRPFNIRITQIHCNSGRNMLNNVSDELIYRISSHEGA